MQVNFQNRALNVVVRYRLEDEYLDDLVDYLEVLTDRGIWDECFEPLFALHPSNRHHRDGYGLQRCQVERIMHWILASMDLPQDWAAHLHQLCSASIQETPASIFVASQADVIVSTDLRMARIDCLHHNVVWSTGRVAWGGLIVKAVEERCFSAMHGSSDRHDVTKEVVSALAYDPVVDAWRDLAIDYLSGEVVFSTLSGPL